MSFLSKRRKLQVGGISITVTSHKGVLQSFEMGGIPYSANDPIGKSFRKDFLDFLEKQDGREPINLGNDLYKKDSEIENMVYKQQLTLKAGMNKHLKSLFAKNSLKNMKTILKGGLITNRNVLDEAKKMLEKPRGLRSIAYKSILALSNLSLGGIAESIKPKEFDMDKYTTLDYSKKEEIENEVNEDDVYKQVTLDFMKLLSETNKELLAAQKEANRLQKEQIRMQKDGLSQKALDDSKPEIVEESTSSTKSKSNAASQDEDVKAANNEAQKEELPKVDFKSKEVKDDIFEKWKKAKTNNISSEEPCPEFLNINAVRFNGISLDKLSKWKENELGRKNTSHTPEIADGYIEKNITYARELESIGILKQTSDNEFEFSSPIAKEVLYKEYGNSVESIREAFSDVATSLGANTQSVSVKTPSTQKKKEVDISKVMSDSQNKMTTFLKDNSSAFNEDEIKDVMDRYDNLVEGLKQSGASLEIRAKEISGFVNSFISNKESSMGPPIIGFDEISAYGDYQETEVGSFEKFAYHASDLSEGLREEENSDQRVVNALMEQEAEKLEKEKAEKQASRVIK